MQSLGEINHVLVISDADVNASMIHMSAVSEHDSNVINISKSFAESSRCEQREKWRVARQAEKDALAKRGVRLLCKTPSDVTPIPTKWVYTIKSDRRYKARMGVQGCKQDS